MRSLTFRDLKSLINEAAKGVLPDVYMDRVDVVSISNGISINNSYVLSEILNSDKYVSLNELIRNIRKLYLNPKIQFYKDKNNSQSLKYFINFSMSKLKNTDYKFKKSKNFLC